MPTVSDYRTIAKPDAMRAAFAWACVDEAERNISLDKKKYDSFVKDIPVLLKSNGLTQTLAFLYAKPKDAQRKMLFVQVCQYLELKKLISASANGESQMESVLSLKPEAICYATDETLAMLEWLKRFASGRFGG